MSYTIQYLQSELAAQEFEVSVLKRLPASALEDNVIQQGMSILWQNGLARAITGPTTLDKTIRVLAADLL
jgi:hypothetical protein